MNSSASQEKLGAVIFDMDGLMLDTEPIYCWAWQRAAAQAGYALGDRLYLDCVGITNQDAEAILLRAFGPTFPLLQFRKHWEESWWERVNSQGVDLKRGLLPLLDLLENRGLPKAVATSTARAEAERMLQRAQLATRFPVVVAGDEVQRGKPAPDIYLVAAARLCVRPAQCLVLEDAIPGLQSALAAGMRAILVPDLKQPSEDEAARALCVCQSLNEVRKFLCEHLQD